MRSLISATPLLTVLLAVYGQEPSTKALEANASFRAAAEKTFLQYENSLSTHCTQITPDWSRAQQTTYVAPTFDTQGKLAAGVWAEMVPGVACAESRTFRALVVVREGRINLAPRLPGTSNASPVLEHDARLAVAGAVHVHDPSLRTDPPLDVLDTELIGANPPPAHESWREVWLIRLGGRRMRVPIEFVPDAIGTGTSFKINPKAIVDIPGS